ncbi:hypothetical protein RA086_00340 [Lactiplantibacillus sp. WILCCON 0030]|uniref:TOTE conflict system primase domain-containing protein n=1 Tax=Lactiplantibacillus brownii TaxID=3069269 RepID=A0ABU1A537_9LACO|nr:hypothetical protein [Lactiplantibacillus brownii]MDQ7936096.1 hypothetical protein [Lactiplantibacillus brownii]
MGNSWHGPHSRDILKAIATDAESGERQAVYFDQVRQQLMIEPLAKFQQRTLTNHRPKIQLTTAEKLALYRRRFTGRQDVYAKRYFNKQAQRDVYSPVTSFINGRPNKDDPQPLTDAVIKAHLKGQIFIGIYPLLKNETTNFLVIDVDKHNWQEIMTSLVQVCKQLKLPTAVEKSQSGHGGHLWFFFEQAITATVARRLGQAVLKRAMAINPDISFKAFDRLFPNQDTLPAGGYGNLIAAPLQYERMQLWTEFICKRPIRAICGSMAVLAGNWHTDIGTSSNRYQQTRYD